MSESTINRKELAAQYHDKGCNCCQAVCLAFQDKTDLDEKTLFRVAEGLGLGMGGMEGTCGAISAAAILAGLKCSSANLEHPDSKAISYKAARACIQAFKDKNGTVVCKSLKGVDSADKKPIRLCPDCISDAVEIIEELLYAEN